MGGWVAGENRIKAISSSKFKLKLKLKMAKYTSKHEDASVLHEYVLAP